jgi:iron complex transport system substrate-binding protein
MTPRRTARFAALLVVVGLAATGCAAASPAPVETASTESLVPLTELTPLASPRTYEGPSTATLAATSIGPVATDPEQTLPVTVTSHDLSGDTEVTVDSAERVLGLSLSGSIAATIYGLGLGDSLVGRDISTTMPEAADLPLVTSGGHSINSESVIALRPTLVITDGTIGPIDVILQLRDAGIDVVFVAADPSIEGTAELSRQVAAALGVADTGELLAERETAEIADVTAQIATLVPEDPDEKIRMAFLYLRGSAGIYYLFGEGSGADVLIDALGGVDVAAEIDWSGMKPMTDEALVAANPDLILVMTKGIESAGGVDGLLADKPAVALTNAGKNRRFVDMADGEILGFGPRTPGVLDALARAIYAPEASPAE